MTSIFAGRSYPVNENSNNIGPRYQANGSVDSGRNTQDIKVPAPAHHNTIIQPSQPVPQHQPVATPSQLPSHPPPVTPVTQIQHHHSHSTPFPPVNTQPAPAPQTEQRKSPVTDQQSNSSQQRKVPRG